MAGWPRTCGMRIAISSMKHHDQSSPGWIERMIGCPLEPAWALACRFGDESQQPTCPHARQIRRWHQLPPTGRQSSQPSTASGSSVTSTLSRCVQAVI